MVPNPREARRIEVNDMRNKTVRFNLAAIAAVLLLSFFTSSAQAALKAIGPTSPVTDTPAWCTDLGSVAVGPGLEQNGFCSRTPRFDAAVTNPPNAIRTTGP